MTALHVWKFEPSAFSFEPAYFRFPLIYLTHGLWPLELLNGYPYLLLLLKVFGNHLYAHDS